MSKHGKWWRGYEQECAEWLNGAGPAMRLILSTASDCIDMRVRTWVGRTRFWITAPTVESSTATPCPRRP